MTYGGTSELCIPRELVYVQLAALIATDAPRQVAWHLKNARALGAPHWEVRAVRAILDRVDCITIPSHAASPVIHLQIRWPTLQVPLMTSVPSNKPSNPLSVKPRDPPQFNIELEERLLQEVVEEALAQGVMVTRAKRLRGQELIEVRPSVKLAITAALSRKECEKAAAVVKAAFVKVIGKRR